jgi:hypothetical protein
VVVAAAAREASERDASLVRAASAVVPLLRVVSDAELLPVAELVPLAELVLVDGLLAACCRRRERGCC